jgi:hypothetical protein
LKLDTFSFSKCIIATLLLSLLSPTVYARSTKLVEPQAVTINCNLSEKQMKSGIQNGGKVRNWTVVSQASGQTELNYIKGGNKHSINVNVSYTENTFAITYKDSFNLNYKVNRKGGREIHPSAVKWMANLSGDILRLANIQCLDEPNHRNASKPETSSTTDEFRALVELRDGGIITEEEFQKLKSEVLERD